MLFRSYEEIIQFLNISPTQMTKELANFEPFREILAKCIRTYGPGWINDPFECVGHDLMECIPEWCRLIDNFNAAEEILESFDI